MWKSRGIGVVLGLLAVYLWAGAACAQESVPPTLCGKCKDMMFTADIGSCRKCKGHTSSGAHRYCNACAIKFGKCKACDTSLGTGQAKATDVKVVKPDTGAKKDQVDLVVEGAVEKIVDHRPKEMYPNYFAVVKVGRVKEGTSAKDATSIRITDPPHMVAGLKAGQEGTFCLKGPTGLQDCYTLLSVGPKETVEFVAVRKYVKEAIEDTPYMKSRIEKTLGQISAVQDEVLAEILPGHRFFLLRFMMYPVGISPPKPLKGNNLFAVKAGTVDVTHITAFKQLQGFFAATVSARDKDSARAAAHAYAVLRKELSQDGFFRFKIEPSGFHVETTPDGILVRASIGVVGSSGKPGGGPGRPVLGGSNSGSIDFEILFSANTGVFLVKNEESSLKAGMRPICQSLRLTHPNERVRTRSERALLIMGRNALPYLRTQAGKTTGRLQKEIRALIERVEAGEGGPNYPGGQPEAN